MANKRLLKQILAADHPELLSLLEEEKPDTLTGILEKITLMKGDKGDDGYAPVKGVDYFDGEDGDDGENYLLTDEDKAEIAAQIEVPVVKQIIQKTETIKEIPIVKEVAVRDTAKQVAEKLNTLEGALEASVIKDLPSFESFLKKIKKEKLIEMRDVNGMPLNMNDMRWHGGGISNITDLIQAGSNITITGLGTASSPYIINSTGGGSGSPSAPLHSIQYNHPLGSFAGDAAFIRDITDATNRYGAYIGPVSGATNNHNLWTGNLTVPYDPYGLTTAGSNVFHQDTPTADSLQLNTAILNSITGSSAGLNAQAIIGGVYITNNNDQVIAQGFEGDVFHNGSGTLSTANSVVGYMEATGGGIITDASTLFGGGIFVNGANSKIVNFSGLHIGANSLAAGGAITNQYGILIDSITGGTLNRAIETGAAGDVLFGYLAGTGTRAVLASALGVLSAGGLAAGFQQPTGTVNGTNAIFVFVVAPNVVVVDGVAKQKVSSDGTANWTGTTTITLAVAPNSDVFGAN